MTRAYIKCPKCGNKLFIDDSVGGGMCFYCQFHADLADEKIAAIWNAVKDREDVFARLNKVDSVKNVDELRMDIDRLAFTDPENPLVILWQGNLLAYDGYLPPAVEKWLEALPRIREIERYDFIVAERIFSGMIRFTAEAAIKNRLREMESLPRIEELVRYAFDFPEKPYKPFIIALADYLFDYIKENNIRGDKVLFNLLYDLAVIQFRASPDLRLTYMITSKLVDSSVKEDLFKVMSPNRPEEYYTSEKLRNLNLTTKICMNYPPEWWNGAISYYNSGAPMNYIAKFDEGVELFEKAKKAGPFGEGFKLSKACMCIADVDKVYVRDYEKAQKKKK